MVLFREPRAEFNAFIVDFRDGGVFAEKEFQHRHYQQ
jgi:hypothetical protein